MRKSRQHITVSCKKCQVKWLKRRDTLKEWKGHCRSCAMKLLEECEGRKKMKRENGLCFIAKYGKLTGPKDENRKRGEHHWAYGVRRIGKDSPNWKGGVTDLNQTVRHSLEYKKWRESVFKRDSHTCINCEQKGGKLNADHIKPFCLYPDLRLEISNGRTLCESCHRKIGWCFFKENNPQKRHKLDSTLTFKIKNNDNKSKSINRRRF